LIWLFASVVLLLLVFHAGFRKFALWFGGVAAAVAAIGFAVWYWNETHPKSTTAAVDISDLPVPPPGTPGATSKVCPPGVHDKSCFDPTTAVIVCEEWQHPAKDTTTGVQSCYDPHDAAQLARHLKECAPVPAKKKAVGPWNVVSTQAIADDRGIPCNVYDQFDNDCPAPPATPWPGCMSHDSKSWTKDRKPAVSPTRTKSAGQLVPPEDLPRTPEFTCPPGVPSTPGRCFQPVSQQP
jgi:hypothetical protein